MAHSYRSFACQAAGLSKYMHVHEGAEIRDKPLVVATSPTGAGGGGWGGLGEPWLILPEAPPQHGKD